MKAPTVTSHYEVLGRYYFCLPIFKDAPNNHIIIEHENMLRWSTSMDLTINTKKCQSLTIAKRMECERIDLDGIQPAEKVKILGVWFDVKGGWKTHIDALTKASSRNCTECEFYARIYQTMSSNAFSLLLFVPSWNTVHHCWLDCL